MRESRQLHETLNDEAIDALAERAFREQKIARIVQSLIIDYHSRAGARASV